MYVCACAWYLLARKLKMHQTYSQTNANNNAWAKEGQGQIDSYPGYSVLVLCRHATFTTLLN